MKSDEIYVGYSSLDDLLDRKEEILKQYPEAKDFYLIAREEYGSTSIYLEFMREETPEELAAIARALKVREEVEKETYLRLKKKFGESDV